MRPDVLQRDLADGVPVGREEVEGAKAVRGEVEFDDAEVREDSVQHFFVFRAD